MPQYPTRRFHAIAIHSAWLTHKFPSAFGASENECPAPISATIAPQDIDFLSSVLWENEISCESVFSITFCFDF